MDKQIKREWVKNYFDYHNEDKLSEDEVLKWLDEESVLMAVEILPKERYRISGIYFRLFVQVEYLKKDFENNKKGISRLYYLIGYFIGTILKPFSYEELGVIFINKALEMETDEENIKRYIEVRDSIN